MEWTRVDRSPLPAPDHILVFSERQNDLPSPALGHLTHGLPGLTQASPQSPTRQALDLNISNDGKQNRV